MGKFINHEPASAFLHSIDNPIVQTLVRSSYTTILMSDAVVDGEFDLLYFFRIMEEFLRDREKLAKALMGDFGDDKAVWGNDVSGDGDPRRDTGRASCEGLDPTLRVGMPSGTPRVPSLASPDDAERRRPHSHAERGNEGMGGN
jgi:hypothetical protein